MNVLATRREKVPEAAILPGSEFHRCDICGHQVVLSPSTVKALNDPTYQDRGVLCETCFAANMPEGAVPVVSMEGLAEAVQIEALHQGVDS